MAPIPSVARLLQATVLLLALMTAAASGGHAQTTADKPFKPEELEQVVAPIALYPDPLLAQVLMAATYPLEVVQAERWQKQNKNLKGESLKAAVDKQPWDASVKSLVEFPDVLAMMSEKLDWTQKLGDAFLAQQKEVMDTVQTLRKRAKEEGNLESSKEQTVTEKEEKIVIEPADPQVVYVPVYNPTVVYGVWPYPAYPPYYYYPPAYVYPPGGMFFSFSMGVMWGAAWGHYAHGGCNWHSGDIDIDINRNTNINRGDRVTHHGGDRRQGQGQGQKWQHNPEHRQGVAYRDQATGQKYNRAGTRDSVQSRENYRGYADQGRQELARGGGDAYQGRQDAARPSTAENRSAGRDTSAQRGDAFAGMDRGGSTTRDYSSRGSTSRQSMSGSRGGYGGGSRGFGGGGRGGGRR